MNEDKKKFAGIYPATITPFTVDNLLIRLLITQSMPESWDLTLLRQPLPFIMDLTAGASVSITMTFTKRWGCL